jgi:hypothetical protein
VFTRTGVAVRVPVPLRVRAEGGAIVAPNGSELVPTTNPQPDSTLVKALVLARAWRWQRMLDDGVYTSGQRDRRHR